MGVVCWVSIKRVCDTNDRIGVLQRNREGAFSVL